jgi:hypothetical protein
MKMLKTDANTSIQNLSEFLNEADKADRIRARDENGTTVLYVRNRSLKEVLKEIFIPEHRQQVRANRKLAEVTIQNILKRSFNSGIAESGLNKISEQLSDYSHDIHPNKIGIKINHIYTSNKELESKVARSNVQFAWHASLDEFVFNHGQSQSQGITRLINIGHTEEEDKDALITLIQNSHPKYAIEEIVKGLNAFNIFMQVQGTQSSTDEIDYSRINEFARMAHQAILSAAGNESQNQGLLEQLSKEPLESAKLFFAAICNPRNTPIKIDISSPKKATADQELKGSVNDYRNILATMSKANALKTIALKTLEDRQKFPEQTIKILLPEGLGENEIQAALIEVQNILRNIA